MITEQVVGAVVATQRVVSGTAKQEVGPAVSFECVVARCDRGVVVESRHGLHTGVSEQDVVPAVTRDMVISTIAM